MAEAFLAVLIGLPMTLLVTAAAFGIGMVGAVPLMLGLRSGHRLIWWPVRLLVDIIRGIPPIVWLFLLYFGVSIGSIRFNSLSAAIVGLGVISSAYLAEIYRGGFATLPSSQTEAASALGLSRFTTFWRVLAPQAGRTALPSMVTFLLSLIKDSSIASTIGVSDMVYSATVFSRQNPDIAGVVPFLMAAVVYAVVSIPVAIITRRMDTQLAKGM